MNRQLWISTKGQVIVFVLSLAATFLPVAWIVNGVMNHTGGTFMYPLDDTFIHMEIANNLANQGTWGVNPGEFGSASSSLLYTLILSILFKGFGPSVYIPFLVNCVAAVALIYVVQRWLQRQNVHGAAQAFILLCAIFFTPLPMLILSGMEHTLQCLVSFLFITKFAEWMQESEVKRDRLPSQLFIYGMLLPAIRYEGLFLIAIACCILLFARRWGQAMLLGIVSLLPVLLFGIYSISKGSYPLPNSVLVKSETTSLSPGGLIYFFSNIVIEKLTLAKNGITALATQRLLLILPLAYLLLRRQVGKHSSYSLMILLLTLCTLMHLALATTGWFYRYEAYLVLCSIVVVTTMIYRYGRQAMAEPFKGARLIAGLLLFILVFPLVLRSTAGFTKAKQACINIYEQQFQMGRFLNTYYNHDVIAANDIGAVSWFTRGRIVDLWGLGSIEIARSRKGGYWTPDLLDSISRRERTAVAIVYDSWFTDSLLQRWNKVATWQVRNNVILGDDIVSFYTMDDSGAPALRRNLELFQSKLPSGVEVTYY
jgi:hypothetical protein